MWYKSFALAAQKARVHSILVFNSSNKLKTHYERKKTMKKLLAVLLAASMVVSLAACGGSASSSAAPASSVAPAPAPASSAAAAPAADDASKYEVTKPITITWWHALESQYDELVAEVVDDFNKSQDLITVEAQYIGKYADVNEALVAAHAAGTGLPGVVVANTDYVASYGANGVFEDLTPYIAATKYDVDDFGIGLLDSAKYGDKQVSLPFLHSTQVIYYNKDMAKKANLTVPATINDFDAFLKDAAKASGGVGTMIPGWDQWYFETLFLNEGVKIITEDNTCDLNSDTAKAVTSKMQQWCNDGVATWAFGKDASANMRQSFYDGKTFSVMHTSSLYNTYVDKCDFEVGMAWYPASTTGAKNSEVGGCVLGIPAKNDQETKNAAWVFLQYLCGKTVNMKWAKGTGYLPTRNSVLKTDEGKAFLAEKPEFTCIFDNLDLIKPRIQNAAWSQLATTWKNYMNEMLAEKADVAKTSDAMVEEIDEILEDNK